MYSSKTSFIPQEELKKLIPKNFADLIVANFRGQNCFRYSSIYHKIADESIDNTQIKEVLRGLPVFKGV
jgi:hypothetical protein